MAATPEELEFLKSGAERAATLLPAAIARLERETALVKLYEDTIAAWEATQANPEPPKKAFKVMGIHFESQRAARGEAQDRILRIMEKFPGIKAKDVQKELERENGLVYGLSTIYRVMEMVAGEAAKKEESHENEQIYLKAKPSL